jgi:hypothetical protein
VFGFRTRFLSIALGLVFALVAIRALIAGAFVTVAVYLLVAFGLLAFAFATRRPRKAVAARPVTVAVNGEDAPRTKGKRKPPAPLVNNIWPGKHGFGGDVVGESNYQDALTAAVGAPPTSWNEATVMASLVCEPDNPHDQMAVAVFVNGQRVGYLRAEHARAFHERLKRRGIAGQTTHCGALISGGGKTSDGTQRLYGIRLNIQPFN